MGADVKSSFIFSKASFCSIVQSHFLFLFNILLNGSIIIIYYLQWYLQICRLQIYFWNEFGRSYPKFHS